MNRTMQNLIRFRKNRSISQTELSRNMGISRGELSTIERGKRHLTPERIGKYLKAINIEDKNNSKNGLTNVEQSDLIEGMLIDIVDILTVSLNMNVDIHISKTILDKRSTTNTILPDGRTVEINVSESGKRLVSEPEFVNGRNLLPIKVSKSEDGDKVP